MEKGRIYKFVDHGREHWLVELKNCTRDGFEELVKEMEKDGFELVVRPRGFTMVTTREERIGAAIKSGLVPFIKKKA